MTDLIDYGKLQQDRKRWNRTVAQFDDTVEKCEYCGGPMEETIVADRANDSVEYYPVCNNPDCPTNN